MPRSGFQALDFPLAIVSWRPVFSGVFFYVHAYNFQSSHIDNIVNKISCRVFWSRAICSILQILLTIFFSSSSSVCFFF